MSSKRTRPLPHGGSRRDEILAAARQLISRAGVHATSMRDLAKEIGVTEGALYRHFVGKDELVAALFAQEASRLRGWLESHLEPNDPPWQQLDALVESFMAFGHRHPESFRLILELHDGPGSQPRPQGAMPRDLFLNVLARIAEAEGGRFHEPLAVVLMTVGSMARLLAGVRAGLVRSKNAELLKMVRRTARAVVDAALER